MTTMNSNYCHRRAGGEPGNEATPDSLLSFPSRGFPPNSLFQKGREPSAATGLSSAEHSEGNAHIKECTQQVPQLQCVHVHV